jgi:molybdopterin-guanine dinucleotide biosynthesis protein A
LQAALEAGTLKMRQAIENLQYERWTVPDDAPLRNINTPEDWLQLLRQSSS